MDILNKKSLQFELWHECNSKCKFCYLGSNNIKTPVSLKLKAIKDTYSREAYKYHNDKVVEKEYEKLLEDLQRIKAENKYQKNRIP